MKYREKNNNQVIPGLTGHDSHMFPKPPKRQPRPVEETAEKK
jgi:hypothetical protein